MYKLDFFFLWTSKLILEELLLLWRNLTSLFLMSSNLVNEDTRF